MSNAPNPITAKQVAMLTLLAGEQACAEGAYHTAYVTGRPDAACRELRVRAVQARLRHRSFFRTITGWHRWPEVATAV